MHILCKLCTNLIDNYVCAFEIPDENGKDEETSMLWVAGKEMKRKHSVRPTMSSKN